MDTSHTQIFWKKLCNIQNAITLVFEVRSHYFYTIFLLLVNHNNRFRKINLCFYIHFSKKFIVILFKSI